MNVAWISATTLSLPKRIFGGGGRISWNDAGQSPNVHFAYFDTGSIPVVIALTNLAEKPGAKKSPKQPGPNSGYIVYCEGSWLAIGINDLRAYDLDTGQILTLVASDKDDQDGHISPDGRWLAYESNISGEWEIYVVPFQPGWAHRMPRSIRLLLD